MRWDNVTAGVLPQNLLARSADCAGKDYVRNLGTWLP